jgi:predicted lipid-binding transport protein (Tim44 family)
MPLDILFFLGIAVFAAYKLYTVLGTRTGHERPPERLPERPELGAKRPALDAPPGAAQDSAAKDNVTPFPRRPAAMDQAVSGPAAEGVAAIMAADRNFSPPAFLDGAKMAHEMIVQAFANGDRAALQPLLAPDVFASFSQAIAGREAAGHRTEFTFVGCRKAELANATLQGRSAEVTVRFVCDMVSATRDAAGEVIDGVAGTVREVTDVWTFARDVRSSDPNWKLVATGEG